MHEEPARAVDELFPWVRESLERLVRIPSVSADGPGAAPLRASADATAALLAEAGLEQVRVLDLDGAAPAVFAEAAGPPGSPTVLLYAHHDVQPAGDLALWSSPPFEPIERDGRLYGRGACDDKSGIATHLGAIRAHGGRLPVGVKVLVEGEEELGSPNLPRFLSRYADALRADAIVVADSEHWRVGAPALTTSLRGLVDCTVEVRTLRAGLHSGQFGGVVPDALTVLARLLATLHDDRGRPAVEGLTRAGEPDVELDAQELRREAGVEDGVELIGEGSVASRLWTQPAISVLAIDAPRVSEAINQIVPVARAKVSVRIAPGDDPDRAMGALIAHLERSAPWGASASVIPGSSAQPFRMAAGGRGYEAFREAFHAAWGRPASEIGVGGTIPFVAAFAETFPGAEILLTGVGEPRSRIHGPDESQDLGELRRNCLAEAIALRLLAG